MMRRAYRFQRQCAIRLEGLNKASRNSQDGNQHAADGGCSAAGDTGCSGTYGGIDHRQPMIHIRTRIADQVGTNLIQLNRKSIVSRIRQTLISSTFLRKEHRRRHQDDSGRHGYFQN